MKLAVLASFCFCLCFFYCCRASPFDVHAKCPHLLTGDSLRDSPPPNGTLRVMVPWYVGFEPFVKFRPGSCLVDGFSVQVFLSALRYVPHALHYQFVLYGDGNKTPNYEDMLDLLHNKTVDAVVADVTITRERMKKVGFTAPYMAASLAMVTSIRYGRATTLWDFLSPFTWQLWIMLFAFFSITGIVFFWLEDQNRHFDITTDTKDGRDNGSSHGGYIVQGQPLESDLSAQSCCNPPSQDPSVNEVSDRTSSPSQTSSFQDNHSNLLAPITNRLVFHRRLMNAYWFVWLCVFESQNDILQTYPGRIVTGIWLFAMLIFDSSYTASLTSLLSIQNQYPAIDGLQALYANKNISVGYLGGYLIQSYITKLGLENHPLRKFTSKVQYIQALKEDSIGVVVEELPYITVFLQSECGFTVVSNDGILLPSFGGLGFAFQKGDPLISALSRAILQMGEDGTLQVLKNGWKVAGNINSCNSEYQHQNLSLIRFGGLFAIIGVVYFLCGILRFFTAIIKNRGTNYDFLHALPGFQRKSTTRLQIIDKSLSRRSNRICDASQQDPFQE